MHLPDYPGSTWRGAFGHAFRAAACTWRHPPRTCRDCAERQECPYPSLFESDEGAQPVRPYVFEPQSFGGYFSPASPIMLDFVLFGWLNGWLPLIIDALQRLGARGLGLREPARLALTELRQQVGPNGEAWAPILQPGQPGPIQLPIEPLRIPPAPRRARLDLITPLRIKHRGAFVQPDVFCARDLLIALARRVEACATIMEELPLTPEPEQWLADADHLLERAHLAWRDTHHYSTRQREALKLGGLTGCLFLRGAALERIWPWLWLGQWLHLGASTTIGLGRYVLRAE